MAYIYSPWKKVEAPPGSSNVNEKNAYGHICEVTLDTSGHTADIVTPPFDWAVTTDFTIICNADATNLNTVNLSAMSIEGSANGTTYAEMSTLGATAIDSVSVHFIHDITTHGVMPFMRYQSDGFSGAVIGSGTASFKIMIIPHVA